MSLLVVFGCAVVLVAAVRSTWSPCGLSMLSTITPLAERGRHHRFAVTAAWFIAGATLGGATLGAVAALLATGFAALDWSTTVVVAIAGVAAAVAVASDLQLFGFRLPTHTRQVDEVWLGKYRPWVYGAGFGWQIGVGLATYIMTAGVYLMILLAALTASPAAALALGTAFGFLRGLAVLLGARITGPDQLFAFHRRFDAIGPYARAAVIVVEAAVVVVAAGYVVGPLAGLGVAALLVLAVTATRRTSNGSEPALA